MTTYTLDRCLDLTSICAGGSLVGAVVPPIDKWGGIRSFRRAAPWLFGAWAAIVLADAFLSTRLAPVVCGPVLVAGVDKTDSGGQATGEGVEGQDNFCPLSEITISRPRRRAIWVRRLETVLGVGMGRVGKLLRGRWVPDLPTREWNHIASLIANHLESGVKILGGGSVHCLDNKPDQYYLVVELADGTRQVLYHELLFRLANYALLRERDALLAQSLKLRALDWCKKVGLSQPDTWIAVNAALRMAWQVSREERYTASCMPAVGTTRYWWL